MHGVPWPESQMSLLEFLALSGQTQWCSKRTGVLDKLVQVLLRPNLSQVWLAGVL